MDVLGWVLTMLVVANCFWPEDLGGWIAKVRKGYMDEMEDEGG